MKIPSQFPAIFLASFLALIATGMGLAALSQANIQIAQKSVLDGSYQRIYETRFEQEIPLRDASIHVWNAVLLKLFGQTRAGAVLSSDGWMFTEEEFLLPSNDVDFVAELELARSTLSGLGIPLVLILVPDKSRIYADKFDRPRSEVFETRYDRLLAIAEAANFGHLDVRPLLSVSQDRPQTFMRTDTHWSPEGAARVADGVALAVTDLDFPRSDFRTEATGARPFDGDLLVFAQTGALRSWAGPEPEMIAEFQTTNLSNASLFGDVAPPVALVGTSFSARSEFHFEGFLKQALGADVINYSQSGRGPFAPMQDFLGMETLITNPPALVLWEIPERFVTLEEKS